MRFPIALDTSKLHSVLSDFIAITGWEPWEKRRGELMRQLQENRLLADLFGERHSLEAGVFRLIDERRLGARPKQIRDLVDYQIASFMSTTVGFYRRLEPSAQKRLAGRILDGLQSDTALYAMYHEMTIAAHFLKLGFDVDPHDLRAGGGFDFLIGNADIEAEVECKLATVDLGRQVHRRRSYELAAAIQKQLAPMRSSISGGYIVKILLNGRLTGHHALLASLADAALDVVQNKTGRTSAEFEMSIQPFSLEASPFQGPSVSSAALRDFVAARTGVANPNAFVIGVPGRSAVVFVVQCVKPDKVADGIYHQLRAAAKNQFSRSRPAVLVVRLPGLTNEDLRSLAEDQRDEPNALQAVATRLFRNEERKHLHTVAYLPAGTMRTSSHVRDNRRTFVTSESGACYVFTSGEDDGAGDAPYKFFPVADPHESPLDLY